MSKNIFCTTCQKWIDNVEKSNYHQGHRTEPKVEETTCLNCNGTGETASGIQCHDCKGTGAVLIVGG